MKIKKCKICKHEKSVKEFPFHQKSKNTYRPECRECFNRIRREIKGDSLERRRLRARESYYRHRETRIEGVCQYQKREKKKVYEWNRKCRQKCIDEFNEYKRSLKCSKCEENHISCLEFHHVDPSKKDGLISKMRYTRIKLKEELKKCIVLCSNCHRKLHYNEKHKENVHRKKD